eukprot:g19198.t1
MGNFASQIRRACPARPSVEELRQQTKDEIEQEKVKQQEELTQQKKAAAQEAAKVAKERREKAEADRIAKDAKANADAEAAARAAEAKLADDKRLKGLMQEELIPLETRVTGVEARSTRTREWSEQQHVTAERKFTDRMDECHEIYDEQTEAISAKVAEVEIALRTVELLVGTDTSDGGLVSEIKNLNLLSDEVTAAKAQTQELQDDLEILKTIADEHKSYWEQLREQLQTQAENAKTEKEELLSTMQTEREIAVQDQCEVRKSLDSVISAIKELEDRAYFLENEDDEICSECSSVDGQATKDKKTKN